MPNIIINGNSYDLKCTTTDCNNGLHCFKPSIPLQRKGIEKGCCRNCKSTLIDWTRLYALDKGNYDYAREAFKLEFIRNVFWSIKKPTDQMKVKINKLTDNELRETVAARLKATLSKPHNENHFDGRQTSISDQNIVHWAQHATGTCCRICLEEWYGIDKNQAQISDREYEYFEWIVLQYIREKMSEIE